MNELNQIETIVLHYLQGNISEDEMRRLVVWLGESNKNKQLLFELKNIYELRKGGNYPDKKDIAQSLKRLKAKMKVPPVSKKQRYLTWFYRYAAAVAILIVMTLSVKMLFREDMSLSYIELSTESGEIMNQISLPDGSEVNIYASTKLKYPDRFDDNIREVFLDGEAFFDVTHNENAPFVVHTDKQKITVLGTTFNVMDYSADDFAVTTLVSGSVKMQTVSKTGTTVNEYILENNQQTFLDKTTSEVTLHYNVKIDPTNTQVNKVYQFRERPLLEITQRLEKFYGVKIQIADESLKNVEYSGTFQTDQDIDEVMKFLNFGKEFSYTIENDIIIIMLNQ